MKPTGNQKGQTVIFVALAMIILLALVGLAIDTGMAFGVKAKLSSAVDAASLAGANSASMGVQSSIQVATRRFNANFPAGYLSSHIISGPTTTVLTDTPSSGQTQVTVTASAAVPTYFMRVMGWNQLTPGATAQAVKKDLDMVLVIDTTSSMSNSTGDPQRLVSAVSSFINKFDPNLDRISAIHFATGAVVDVPIRTSGRGFDKMAMTTFINNLPTYISLGGNTNFSEPLWQARKQLSGVSTPSSLRIIVFFTDGDPNAFSANFNGTVGAVSTDSTGVSPPNTDASGVGSSYLPAGPGSSSGPLTGPDFTYRGNGGPYGVWSQGTQKGSTGVDVGSVTAMPDYFWQNGMTFTESTEFGITDAHTTVSNPTRRIINGSTFGYTNVNNAARNLAEDIAIKVRIDPKPIYIYTMGVGANLTWAQGMGPTVTGTNAGQMGQTVLKRMANTSDAVDDRGNNIHNSNQTTGSFFYASDGTQLQQAFDKLANEILRLNK